MFVYSVRATTLRLALLIVLMVSLLIGVIAFSEGEAVAAFRDGESYRYSGVKDGEDRVEFLRQFGIEVARDSETSDSFSLPDSFDRVLLGYNELQKRQGLDLSKYHGKKITRYTYEVINGDYEGAVTVNILVYRGRVIAADVCSSEPKSFVIPLVEFTKKEA